MEINLTPAEAAAKPISNADRQLANRAKKLSKAGDGSGAIRMAKRISDLHQAQVLDEIEEDRAAKGFAGGTGGGGLGSATGIGGNIYLTQQEAAAYLRLSPRTLERHRVTGTGSAYVKLGPPCPLPTPRPRRLGCESHVQEYQRGRRRGGARSCLMGSAPPPLSQTTPRPVRRQPGRNSRLQPTPAPSLKGPRLCPM